jgi:HSP20 family protein
MSTETDPVTTEARSYSERWPTYAPACDVYENRNEVLVLADLPGVAAEDLRIHLEKGELTLQARRPVPLDGRWVGAEYRDIEFRRRFTVPGGIDADRISAELTNGVLYLHLPKSEALRPRQIVVNAG